MDDLKFLLIDTRARVYALWGILVTAGFIATHYYQKHAINSVWTLISVVGLAYMWRVMPLKVHQMRRIFIAWLVPMLLGMIVSGAVFYINTVAAAQLIGTLGAFWLAVMAVGYAWNGIVDPPADWYWFAAVLNAGAAVACWKIEALQPNQYLMAALVTAVSMGALWWFRPRASAAE